MREFQQTQYKVLSSYAYWLTYGEDDELTDREAGLLQAFIKAKQTEDAPHGHTFGHYCVEPESFADDFGICHATDSYGTRCVLTFVFFKD